MVHYVGYIFAILCRVWMFLYQWYCLLPCALGFADDSSNHTVTRNDVLPGGRFHTTSYLQLSSVGHSLLDG